MINFEPTCKPKEPQYLKVENLKNVPDDTCLEVCQTHPHNNSSAK